MQELPKTLRPLADCFDLLDGDKDGMLKLEELFRFMVSATALLESLLSCVRDRGSSPSGHAGMQARVWEKAKLMFTGADMDVKEPVTLAAFTLWKNNPALIIAALSR